MSRSEPIWRALGWGLIPEDKEAEPSWDRIWRRGDETCLEQRMPDYENDDAAAVALLEELRQRVCAMSTTETYWCVEVVSITAGWACHVVAGEQDPIDGWEEWTIVWREAPTFREAVVAGALVLFYGEEP